MRPAYQEAVGRLDPLLGRIAGYHAGWWDAEGRRGPGAAGRISGGKAIRPAFTLAAARAMGHRPGRSSKDPPPSSLLAAAVAVELVHDFSLLHDDIMDGARRRRHRPAAWRVFGVDWTVLTGDALLALAMDELTVRGGTEMIRALNGALLGLCRGQAADLAQRGRVTASGREYVAMVSGKTGSLLGAACQLGALASGADTSRAEALRAFGRHLGIAFQMVDDLLGVWGDPDQMGKPARGDLAERKLTAPVIAALSSPDPAAARLADLYGAHRPLEPAETELAAELVDRTDARAEVEAVAEQHLRAAFTHLRRARPDAEAIPDLHALACFINRRRH